MGGGKDGKAPSHWYGYMQCDDNKQRLGKFDIKIFLQANSYLRNIFLIMNFLIIDFLYKGYYCPQEIDMAHFQKTLRSLQKYNLQTSCGNFLTLLSFRVNPLEYPMQKTRMFITPGLSL